MFPSPMGPPRRARRHPPPRMAYSYEGMCREEVARLPAFDSPAGSPPNSPFDYNPFANIKPCKDPAALNSRANALARRCAALTTHIGHYTAVIEPLKILKLEDVSEEHLLEVEQEAHRVRVAMRELSTQMAEVDGLFKEVRKQKKKQGKGRDIGWLGDDELDFGYEWH